MTTDAVRPIEFEQRGKDIFLRSAWPRLTAIGCGFMAVAGPEFSIVDGVVCLTLANGSARYRLAGKDRQKFKDSIALELIEGSGPDE